MVSIIANIVIACIIILAVLWAVFSIYKKKKNGNECVGCSYEGNCSMTCNKKR